MVSLRLINLVQIESEEDALHPKNGPLQRNLLGMLYRLESGDRYSKIPVRRKLIYTLHGEMTVTTNANKINTTLS